MQAPDLARLYVMRGPSTIVRRMIMHSVQVIGVTLMLFGSAAFAQPGKGESLPDAFRYLLGRWKGIGSGQPGEGAGYFTFAPDLQEKVLVRRNHSEYPKKGDRPAIIHDDLMIVYSDGSVNQYQADYFDNEGHFIHYTVSTNADMSRFIFLSEKSASGPRYRLAYDRISADTVGIMFEIAPPGKPDAFKTYLDGKAFRKKTP
jgi:hypothetical protein